jgi:hypothetical protein
VNATTNSKPAPTTGLCTCGHPAAEHNEDGCMHPHDDGSFRFCPCKAGVAVVGARVAWETNGGEPRRGTIDQLGCSYGCAIAYGALESGERFVVQIARLARAS